MVDITDNNEESDQNPPSLPSPQSDSLKNLETILTHRGHSEVVLTPTKKRQGRKEGMTMDQAMVAVKAGLDPVLPTSLFQSNLKHWTKILAEGVVSSIRYESGKTVCRAALANRDKEVIGSKVELGRCRDVMIDLTQVHGAKSEQEISDPDYYTGPFLLDTGILLTLQKEPETIKKEWLEKIYNSKLLVSISSIAQIHEWLNGDVIIKDNIRRIDFLEILCQGTFKIPLDEITITEAMNLRGDFNGTYHERIMVSTSQGQKATILTKSKAIVEYKYVKSAMV